MRVQQKMNEEQIKTMQHQAQRDEQRQKIYINKRALNEKVRQEVSYAKEEKNQTKELFEHQKNMHVMNANKIKNMIKSQQMEAKSKKQIDFHEKKIRARNQMHEKMAREENERMGHEN